MSQYRFDISRDSNFPFLIKKTGAASAIKPKVVKNTTPAAHGEDAPVAGTSVSGTVSAVSRAALAQSVNPTVLFYNCVFEDKLILSFIKYTYIVLRLIIIIIIIIIVTIQVKYTWT